jgi:hypothetical protein
MYHLILVILFWHTSKVEVEALKFKLMIELLIDFMVFRPCPNNWEFICLFFHGLNLVVPILCSRENDSIVKENHVKLLLVYCKRRA